MPWLEGIRSSDGFSASGAGFNGQTSDVAEQKPVALALLDAAEAPDSERHKPGEHKQAYDDIAHDVEVD